MNCAIATGQKSLIAQEKGLGRIKQITGCRIACYQLNFSFFFDSCSAMLGFFDS
jgi:hypothetical protein